MATPYLCPVCQGHGNVPGGFYTVTPGQLTWSSDRTSELCRQCNGTGIIYGTIDTRDTICEITKDGAKMYKGERD